LPEALRKFALRATQWNWLGSSDASVGSFENVKMAMRGAQNGAQNKAEKDFKK
jgi:hypothetical protein